MKIKSNNSSIYTCSINNFLMEQFDLNMLCRINVIKGLFEPSSFWDLRFLSVCSL